MLAEAERHGEHGVQEAENGAGQHRCRDADPQIAGIVGGGESGHRRDQHDAFDAEVEHAGALGKHLAERGEDQRRRDAQDRREEADLKNLVEDVVHAALRRGGCDSW